MSDETRIVPMTMDQTLVLAKTLAPSALLPDSLRGKPGDIAIVLFTGAELGLGPMTSLRSLSVVKGKAVMSADLMLALVKKSAACEYIVMTDFTPERVTFKTKRKGDPAETVVSFTKADAERAGLWGNNTWKSYPQAMLKARAASTICRAVFPDVVLGIYDDTEALADFKAQPSQLPPSATPLLERVETNGRPHEKPLPPGPIPGTHGLSLEEAKLDPRTAEYEGPEHDPLTGELPLEEEHPEDDVTADMSEDDYWRAKVRNAKTRAEALGEMHKAPQNLLAILRATYNERWAARPSRNAR